MLCYLISNSGFVKAFAKPIPLDNDVQRSMNRRLKIEMLSGVVVGFVGILATAMHIFTS